MVCTPFLCTGRGAVLNANANGRAAIQIRMPANCLMVDINFNGLVFNLHKTFKSE
jgi:hypothetical protein